MLGKLKRAFNILFGLVFLVAVYLFRVFFLATSVVSLVIIGYTFINYILYMNSGSDVELAVCSVTVCLNAIYLYVTVKLGVGMHDILTFVHTVFSIFTKSKSPNDATVGGSNTVVGSKGVFKR